MRRARELGATEVEVVNDSELIAKQINGQYKVKHPDMKPLHAEALAALGELRPLDGAHGAPRAERARRRARERRARRGSLTRPGAAPLIAGNRRPPGRVGTDITVPEKEYR